MKKTFIVEDVIQEVKLRLIKDAYILKKFIDLEFSKYIKEDALMHLTKIMKPNFDAFIEPYSVQMKVSLIKKEGSFGLSFLLSIQIISIRVHPCAQSCRQCRPA